MNWFVFAVLTVLCWGLYGIFLHKGQMTIGDASDAANNRYKAFLLVGVAYFLIAVLAPLVMLKVQNTDWQFKSTGVWWSLIAGVVGAVGAFFVLMAFGAKGTPNIVMSIIFAGAPIVNAVVSMMLHPTKGVKWQFVAGILCAAFGGFLVAYYKPAPAKAPEKPLSEQAINKAE